MPNLSETQASVKQAPRIVRPVGQIEVLSPHMDPEESLGSYSPAEVRNFRAAAWAALPPFTGVDAGDLHDYCERYELRLVRPQLVGRTHGGRLWRGVYRYTIEAEVTK